MNFETDQASSFKPEPDQAHCMALRVASCPLRMLTRKTQAACKHALHTSLHGEPRRDAVATPQRRSTSVGDKTACATDHTDDVAPSSAAAGKHRERLGSGLWRHCKSASNASD